ncbi:carboxymuconolactone decarboxylase family protein [Candidatus Bipolaricaulota bacterium]|nr:carboxymuconolactone decarboxylase family protein [Candidatus Bipolaricaulota bacterium]
MGETEIPKHYRKIGERYPGFADSHKKLASAARDSGPIDDKTAHLIQLAAAIAIRSEGSVHSHARRASEAGATNEEIRHVAMLLATTIGFPTVAAALDWLDNVLD